jgi:hypothetical protein
MARRLSALSLVACLFGCQPATVTTPAAPAPAERNKGDVHIRTPGANIDVERKGTGRDVNVDVRRKDQ